MRVDVLGAGRHHHHPKRNAQPKPQKSRHLITLAHLQILFEQARFQSVNERAISV